jgi:hypothetical protein
LPLIAQKTRQVPCFEGNETSCLKISSILVKLALFKMLETHLFFQVNALTYMKHLPLQFNSPESKKNE